MNPDLRSVIDTSDLVSAALIPESVPDQALQRAETLGNLLISAAAAEELERVLRREKSHRYLSLEKRLTFFQSYTRQAKPVLITESITACRDPKDNANLELAVCGQATHIITIAAYLLALHPFRGISIVTPTDFVAQFPQPGT